MTLEVITRTSSLEENEAIIEQGMTSFVEVGRALQRVRDGGQYIEAGFDSFEDYCEKRWDLKNTHQRQLRSAARVVELLEAGSAAALPQTEKQVRPLVKLMNDAGRFDKATNELRDPEAAERAVITAWEEVVARRGDEPIREKDVREVVSPPAGGGRPGWLELIGQVGDDLTKAGKDLDRFVTALGEKEATENVQGKAGRYAERAEVLVARLREIEGVS